MECASLVAEFGARYGMDDLSLDENGAVGFAVDGRTMILQQIAGTDSMVATIELHDGVDAGAAAVNRLIMRANQTLFMLEGMALVIHSETGRYCLLSRFDVAAMDFVGFDGKIGQFLERADQWGEFLEKFIPVAAEAETSGAPAPEIPDGLFTPVGMMRV